MTRVKLEDGRWFNKDAAEEFEEATRWNGQNKVSKATDSQWVHETLYRTAGGKWVLHHWSQWQGSGQTYKEIDDEAAARWLVANELEPHPACAGEYAALEIQ